MLTELERGKQIYELDVRKMNEQDRKYALDLWYGQHLRCTDGTGQSWNTHVWMPETNAWLWGPCKKCGLYRLTQTVGNCLEWFRGSNAARVLIGAKWPELDQMLGRQSVRIQQNGQEAEGTV